MKRSNPVSVFSCLAVSIALAVLSPSGLSAASSTHTKDTFVENFDIVVPADEGCSGEDVRVFGTLDITVQTTTDSNGKLHVVFHLTPHLQGEGLSTGLEYEPAGPSQIVDMIDANGPRIETGINIINLISPDSTGNLVLRERISLTVNANGTVTVDFHEVTGGCVG